MNKIHFATWLLLGIFVDRMRWNINWDALGITASVACAIHCAILPLFVTALPLFGINIIHNIAFEAGMLLLALSIGIYSLYHGFRKHHHQKLPLALFIAGLLLMVLKLVFIHYEMWILLPAVALIVYAHYLNFRYCRIHDQAHAEDCGH